MKIILLGAGALAFSLSKALLKENLELIQIYNKTPKVHAELKKWPAVEFVYDKSFLKKADLYIICVSDKAIKEVSSFIPFDDVLVVHTSAATPINLLKGNYRKGLLYPLQSFNKQKKISLKGVPFLIEAENKKDISLLKKISTTLSGKFHITTLEQRLKIHLSAIWACNFVNHLCHISHKIIDDSELPFDLLKPLIKETLSKINLLGPYKSQTGPAIRKDGETLERHINLLSDPLEKEIYKLLSLSIEKTYHLS